MRSLGLAGMLALCSLAVAMAWTKQGPGWEENSHYALVRALASGTPRIDRSIREIGDLSTGDVARVNGHLYSDKAPGLAFASLPAFLVLDAAGMTTTGDPTRIEWALGLVAVVLPAVLGLAAVAWAVERVEPGLGALTAVALGLGTLLLPFASMYFSHSLGAALGYGAFALLLANGRRAATASGLLAGLAVTAEYPSAVAAAVLAVFVLANGGLRRLGFYAAGMTLGVAPLLAYNSWAFGSPFLISYSRSLAAHGRLQQGFFGFGAPDVQAAHDLLFSAQGLIIVAPVVAAALVGIVLLYRRGRRGEALVPAAIFATYLLWNSAYFDPFGGLQPGPRFLIFALPFLGVPLAVALQRAPPVVLALAAAGALGLVLITATGAHPAYDGQWLHRAAEREFVSPATSLVGVTGWSGMVPFFFACAAASVLAARSAKRLRLTRFGAAAGAIAVALWALAALAADNEHGSELGAPYLFATAAGAFVLALIATLWQERAESKDRK